jgi:hypothetical protein
MSIKPIIDTIVSHRYCLVKFIENKLKYLLGRTHSFIKDYAHMVNEMKNIKEEEGNILLIFDVVSLFTKRLMKLYIRIINDILDDETAILVKVFLKSTLFSFKGVLYEQIKWQRLGEFLDHLNNRFNHVKFTMEVEEDK